MSFTYGGEQVNEKEGLVTEPKGSSDLSNYNNEEELIKKLRKVGHEIENKGKTMSRNPVTIFEDVGKHRIV